jgi:outer membrane protein OmpA-like peptidoglycan-associated protein/predicted  nucleic acid-binding Zn-ribbon protein
MNGLLIYALLTVSLSALGSTHAAALPIVQDPESAAARMILIADQEPTRSEAAAQTDESEQRSPFAELNEGLAAARARLEELGKAAALAGTASQELQSIKEENQRLAAEVAKLRASRDELLTARAGHEERIADMARTVEQATAEAKRLEEELAAMRSQNAELSNNLARVEAVREKIEREARETQEQLSAQVEALSKSAEQSAPEITRLQARLEDSQRQLEAASSSSETAEQRLVELKEALQSAENKVIRSDQQAAAERAEAGARIAELQSEAEQLRTALAAAESDVDQLARSKRGLEEEVTRLRRAATIAADAARQNLLAVEERIKELNAALVAIERGEPGAKLDDSEATGAPGAEAIDAAMVRATEPPTAVAKPVARPAPPDRAVPASEAAANEPKAVAQPASVSAPPEQAAAEKVDVPTTTSTEAALGAEPGQVQAASATDRQLDPQLIQLTAALPRKKRLQARDLLVDLDAKPDQRGLLMTVPGASLFEGNNETIEPTAHAPLAKVADLIDTYDDHKVMIIGHTDSIGAEAYNRALSQQRADLVRQFFVDRFGVDSSRLLSRGEGESEPVATNATLEGRQANRRIEVVILN